MTAEDREIFRINPYDLSPNLGDDLVYLVQRSISRVRTILGQPSSVSELDIGNGINELAIELDRKITNIGAVYQLRRRLSLHTKLSDHEGYRNAVKRKFLQLLKAGHPLPAHEFYEECGQGIDFTSEIREGFFHLCTGMMPALHSTRIQGGVESDELMHEEYWGFDHALKLYRLFKRHIDFREVCEEAITHLRANGRHEDALTVFNAFKDKVGLSNFEQ